MSEDAQTTPDIDAPETASRPKRGSSWPRVDHPHNLTLNPLRRENIARVLLAEGAVRGFETVEGQPKASAADIDAITQAIAALAEEFGWDITGDKILHLRTMRVAAWSAPAQQDAAEGEASDE